MVILDPYYDSFLSNTDFEWVFEELLVALLFNFIHTTIQYKYQFVIPYIGLVFFIYQVFFYTPRLIIYNETFHAIILAKKVSLMVISILTVFLSTFMNDYSLKSYSLIWFVICIILAYAGMFLIRHTRSYEIMEISYPDIILEKDCEEFVFNLMRFMRNENEKHNDFYIRYIIMRHKEICCSSSCQCQKIDTKEFDIMKTHGIIVRQFLLDVICQLRIKYPLNILLMNFEIYFRFNELKNYWFVSNWNLDIGFGENSRRNFVISQFYYRVEMQLTKQEKVETVNAWQQIFAASFKVNLFYLKVHKYTVCVLNLLENLQKGIISETVVQEGIKKMHVLSGKIDKLFSELSDSKIKTVFYVYLNYLNLNGVNRKKAIELKSSYRNLKLAKTGQLHSEFCIKKSLLMRVSINSHEFSAIKSISDNVSQFLGFLPAELIGASINRLMLDPIFQCHHQYINEFMKRASDTSSKHTPKHFIFKKNGCFTEIELFLKQIPYLHIAGLEFYSFCKMNKRLNEKACLLIGKEEMDFLGSNETAFNNFGIFPFLAMGFTESSHRQLLKKIISNFNPDFFLNPKSMLEKGLTVQFDFSELYYLIKHALIFEYAVDKNEISQYRTNLRDIKSIFKGFNNRVQIYLKLEEQITYELGNNVYLVSMTHQNPKIIREINDLNAKIMASKKSQFDKDHFMESEQDNNGLKKNNSSLLLKSKSIKVSLNLEETISPASQKLKQHQKVLGKLGFLLSFYSIFFVLIISVVFLLFGFDIYYLVKSSHQMKYYFNQLPIFSDINKHSLTLSMLSFRTILIKNYAFDSVNNKLVQPEMDFYALNYTLNQFNYYVSIVLDINSNPYLSNIMNATKINVTYPDSVQEITMYEYYTLLISYYFRLKSSDFFHNKTSDYSSDLNFLSLNINKQSAASDLQYDNMKKIISQDCLASNSARFLIEICLIVLGFIILILFILGIYIEGKMTSEIYYNAILHETSVYEKLKEKFKIMKNKIKEIIDFQPVEEQKILELHIKLVFVASTLKSDSDKIIPESIFSRSKIQSFFKVKETIACLIFIAGVFLLSRFTGMAYDQLATQESNNSFLNDCKLQPLLVQYSIYEAAYYQLPITDSSQSRDYLVCIDSNFKQSLPIFNYLLNDYNNLVQTYLGNLDCTQEAYSIFTIGLCQDLFSNGLDTAFALLNKYQTNLIKQLQNNQFTNGTVEFLNFLMQTKMNNTNFGVLAVGEIWERFVLVYNTALIKFADACMAFSIGVELALLGLFLGIVGRNFQVAVVRLKTKALMNLEFLTLLKIEKRKKAEERKSILKKKSADDSENLKADKI